MFPGDNPINVLIDILMKAELSDERLAMVARTAGLVFETENDIRDELHRRFRMVRRMMTIINSISPLIEGLRSRQMGDGYSSLNYNRNGTISNGVDFIGIDREAFGCSDDRGLALAVMINRALIESAKHGNIGAFQRGLQALADDFEKFVSEENRSYDEDGALIVIRGY